MYSQKKENRRERWKKNLNSLYAINIDEPLTIIDDAWTLIDAGMQNVPMRPI